MTRKYLQGKFIPTCPEKYVGEVNEIRFRSSWERKAMIFFDTNPGILKWNSECTIIPYISPVDNLPHRYLVDFTVKYKTRDGVIKKALVEVKPLAQCSPPKQQKRQTKRLMTEMTTYLTNQSKWAAAKAWCDQHGFEWMVITERELGLIK